VLGRQPFLEPDRWRESQIRASPRRVGAGVPHVALLRGIAVEDRAASGHSTDHVEHLINRHTRAAPDIVHAAGHSARRRSASVEPMKPATPVMNAFIDQPRL
jgi:hypothetical protein